MHTWNGKNPLPGISGTSARRPQKHNKVAVLEQIVTFFDRIMTKLTMWTKDIENLHWCENTDPSTTLN